MKQLVDFKENIHKCSKCGICQGECPIYQVTGNDCAVSRGMFVMLRGCLNGELKLNKNINRYLELCLKCGACSKFCPSGVDAVDIIIAAKQEYFKKNFIERLKTFTLKHFIFGLIPNFVKIFKKNKKSKQFEKKVIFFGGCGSKFKGNNSVVKILNSINIEVISPNFNCCGIPFFVKGDLDSFQKSIKDYIKTVKKYNINEIVTTCASCEKSLKDYIKWAETTISEEEIALLKRIKVKNIYEYLRESNLKLALKKPAKVTYHKPCNINNYDDVKWLLENTDNLEYVEMNDFDKCCGLNGISNFKEYKILLPIFKRKRANIKNTKTNIVLTSCLGCEVALKTYSFNSYRVYDLIKFIANHL